MTFFHWNLARAVILPTAFFCQRTLTVMTSSTLAMILWLTGTMKKWWKGWRHFREKRSFREKFSSVEKNVLSLEWSHWRLNVKDHSGTWVWKLSESSVKAQWKFSESSESSGKFRFFPSQTLSLLVWEGCSLHIHDDKWWPRGSIVADFSFHSFFLLVQGDEGCDQHKGTGRTLQLFDHAASWRAHFAAQQSPRRHDFE